MPSTGATSAWSKSSSALIRCAAALCGIPDQTHVKQVSVSQAIESLKKAAEVIKVGEAIK